MAKENAIETICVPVDYLRNLEKLKKEQVDMKDKEDDGEISTTES